MFSEYASRFLAQSQSRISFAPRDERPQRDDRGGQQRNNGWKSSTASRTYGQRPLNPYQPTSSQLSGFPFSSRRPHQPAPLFYSATDEFREENDEEEHEREIADFYALQRSRRQLGGSDMKESSEGPEDSVSSARSSSPPSRQQQSVIGRVGGIKSSWTGGVASRSRPRDGSIEETSRSRLHDVDESEFSERAPMVDIGLADTLRSEDFDDPPDDLMENPPSVQQLRKPDRPMLFDESQDSQQNRDDEGLLQSPSVADAESVPEHYNHSTGQAPRHDAFWGHVYLLSLAAMFTTWFVVYLHTEAPLATNPIGDTVYTSLHGSFHLLATYTIVSIFVSLLWLAALRSYVRYLVYSIVIVVPIILYSFSLYPFISSIKVTHDAPTIQDYVMRWMSFIPAVLATLWVLAVFRGRLAMQKSISILEFATKILAANPALVVIGFATLLSIVGFTWMWLSMFSRVFLGGHPASRSAISRFVIDTSTWWIGLYFVIVYLWTISMIFGLQRSVTSATVSQWYYHRLAVPAPNSQTVVKAALSHSFTTLFGTIALFTGLCLLVRLPLLIFPRRLTMLLGIAMFSLIPTPIVVLINPLTLSYASIHSQPLTVSARGLTQLHFLAPSDATTSLHPTTFTSKRNDGWSGDARPLLPYRLAKLMLYAARFVMSFALGFGGWATTARSLKIDGAGVRGSLYAYMVGLIAGAIGWSILGAMEGILSCVVDAAVVCWGNEVGSSGRGEARYCREAGHLFGEDVETSPRLALV